MNKRTLKKAVATLVALCLLLTALPGTAAHAKTISLAESQTDLLIQGPIDTDPIQLDTGKLLNYIDAEAFTQMGHIARLPDEETTSSYVFLNEDGTKTVYYLDEVVKFHDSEGVMREKDISLIAGTNSYSTALNNVRLQIPNDLASGVQLSYDGYDISIVPQGGSLQSIPKTAGNSVVYDQYFGTGTKLVYTPTLDGVKEDIILSSYRGISDFSFLLNTDGLNIYHTAEDRYYMAASEEAEMRFWLGNVEIFDANLTPSMGTMAVETVTESQQYLLTISADTSFLQDPQTEYPVTLDPTITVSDNNNGAGAILDAPIYEGYPTSNFGTYQYDRAGYAGTTYKRGRTVVRLAGLLADSGYSTASASYVTSVKFYIAESSGTAAATVRLHPLSSNSTWTETNVTWNSVGSHELSVASASLGGGAYSSFDITSLAKSWKAGNYSSGKCGFILIGASESSVDKSLYSCEHSTSSKRPYVTATYTSSASTITLGNTVIDVDVGATRTIKATTSPSNATVSWSSSNAAVATVSNSGVVTGKKIGTATITATVAGAASKTCTVYVTIADGEYYIRNKSSSKYVDIKNKTMANGTTIYQWDFHGENTQKWIFKYLGAGSYSIRSANSTTAYYLGVNGDSTANNQPVVLRTGTLTNGMKWQVSITTSGAYKITPLTGQSNNRVLALGNATANGDPIQQRDYVSDTNYKDEWDIRPVKPLVLNVCFDAAYQTRYGSNSNSVIEITAQLNSLKDVYRERFGICVSFNTPALRSTYATQNCTTSPDGMCSHHYATSPYCADSSISSLETRHHTNITNILLRLTELNPAYDALLLYIGHKTCANPGGVHMGGIYNGLTYTGLGIIGINRFSERNECTRVMVHEVGHLFGAPDHYGGTLPSTDEINDTNNTNAFSRTCIYGEDRFAENVVSNLTICAGCQARIMNSAEKYYDASRDEQNGSGERTPERLLPETGIANRHHPKRAVPNALCRGAGGKKILSAASGAFTASCQFWVASDKGSCSNSKHCDMCNGVEILGGVSVSDP